MDKKKTQQHQHRHPTATQAQIAAANAAAASASSSPKPPPHPNIHIISSDSSSPSSMLNAITSASAAGNSSTEQPASIAPGDNYSYVQLTAVHDYNYPVVDEPVSSIMSASRRDSTCSLKKRSALDVAGSQQPTQQHHMKDPSTKNRLRCRLVLI